jgi:hypothetical protein
MGDLESKKWNLFSGCGVARRSDAADQDSEDFVEMETGMQRKRLALSGRVVYFTGGDGDTTDGAWVGSVPAEWLLLQWPTTIHRSRTPRRLRFQTCKRLGCLSTPLLVLWSLRMFRGCLVHRLNLRAVASCLNLNLRLHAWTLYWTICFFNETGETFSLKKIPSPQPLPSSIDLSSFHQHLLSFHLWSVNMRKFICKWRIFQLDLSIPFKTM